MSFEQKDEVREEIIRVLPNHEPPAQVVNHLFAEAAREWEKQKLIRDRAPELDDMLRDYAAFPSKRDSLKGSLMGLMEARIEDLRRRGDGTSVGTSAGERLDTVEGLMGYMHAWEMGLAQARVDPSFGNLENSVMDYLIASTPKAVPVLKR